MSFSKRSKPKQKLSPLQEKRVLRISIALVVIALLWVLFAPGLSVRTLLQKRHELQALQQKTGQLEEENEALRKDIYRLQNDPGYLEEIARKDLGLLKKNERVFEFAPRKSAKEKE